MPSFIHAADIHLDSPLRGLANYEGAPVDAIGGATRRAFEALIDLAIERHVAFVLLAGDLYDGDWKDYNTGLFFNRQMARLDREGIRVFVVSGNHDAQSKITRFLRPPSNTYVYGSKRPDTVILQDLGVAIHGQSYTTAAVREDLASGYPEPSVGILNIGLLHTSLDGRPGHEPYAPCSIDTLRAKGYQYWALGHVHTREVVSSDPYILFPGCIQGRHIRESGVKGCSLVSYEGGEILQVEHYPLDVVRWVQCYVSLDAVTTEQALTEAVHGALSDALDEADGRLIAVRLLFNGATTLHTDLQSDPAHFENLVRTVAVEIDEELIWIEKVRFQTSAVRAMEDVLAQGSPLSSVLRAIVEFPTSVKDGGSLFDELSLLKNKLPRELFERDRVGSLDDPTVIKDIVNDAKEHLLARLLTEGDDK